MVIVYVLVNQQSRAGAHKRIQQALQVVTGQYEDLETALRGNGETLGSQESLVNQVQLISDLIDMGENVDRTDLDLSRALSDQAQALGISRAALYTAEGKWVAAVRVENNTVRIVCTPEPGSPQYREAKIAPKKRPMEIDFKASSEPLQFPLNHPMPLPTSAVISRKVENGLLWLNVSAPLINVSEEFGGQMGQILVSAPVGEAFVQRVSGYTGTHVNLFLGSNLSVGDLKDYGKLDAEALTVNAKAGKAGIDQKSGLMRDFAAAGESFTEGLFPLAGDGAQLGTVSILLSSEETKKNVHQMLFWLFIIAVACLALVTPFTWFFANSIAKPINHAIQGLTDGAEHISSAAHQVSNASQSLAESSSEQAASIEETSSSLEVMSNMTKQNAGHANEARAMMNETKQIVGKVNDHMNDMATSIERITKTSEETGKIIKTIDEIAFQTNLLALNAAVEAARAGEAGAGFAVVADEVRNLAMRAADAAQNTATLIESTIQAVSNGNELTNLTLGAVSDNVEIAGKISQLVDEISESSQEQAQGIEQVNKAITRMDDVSQRNAANSEESAAAAEEMNAQAVMISRHVEDLVLVSEGKTNGRRSRKKNAVTKGEFKHDKGVSQPEKAVMAPVQKMKNAVSPSFPEGRPEQIIPFDDDFKDF
ncbi:MAG: hypothetical protein GY850_02765 [bacterium]|nr:hypothetical protein [bacterium]